jgi:hypothetical protein
LEYRVVPAPTQIAGSGDLAARAARAYQEIINREAAQGWSFITMDTTTLQKTSCGFRSRAPVIIKILVFGK